MIGARTLRSQIFFNIKCLPAGVFLKAIATLIMKHLPTIQHQERHNSRTLSSLQHHAARGLQKLDDIYRDKCITLLLTCVDTAPQLSSSSCSHTACSALFLKLVVSTCLPHHRLLSSFNIKLGALIRSLLRHTLCLATSGNI